MNILFLGTIMSDKARHEINLRGARKEPGDLVQKYIIKSLFDLFSKDIIVFSSPRIEYYPKCKVKRIKTESFFLENVKCFTIGYNNIGPLNILNRKRAFVKKCKNYQKMINSKDVLIIIYSLNSTFLQGALSIKKKNPSARICVIVPDLPLFMSNYKWPYSLLKKIDLWKIEKLRKCVDFYSLYSEDMAIPLELNKNSYVVTEGFIDKTKINCNRKIKFNEKKICMYAGDLHKIYGIQSLIDSFKNISINCELHLYGDSELIKQYSLNSNTRYMGFVSPDEVFEKMINADLLINPRPSKLELTKYSFPSKTFEYMASGTPTLMCRLPGVPEEYFKYVYLFDDETLEGFKNTIERILSKPEKELSDMGHSAAMFLLNNKTSEKQLLKILNGGVFNEND